jgi:hypothetical protein
MPAEHTQLDTTVNPRHILTHSHPIITSITPIFKVLTHITHTHPKIKSDAILGLRAH